MLNFKEQGKVEYLVENTLPTDEKYDDWAVSVDCYGVRAYTLYTGYNKLGNKKYANFCVSFKVADPTNVRVDYMNNTIDVREWIENNGIDIVVHEDVVTALRKIYGELAKYALRSEG